MDSRILTARGVHQLTGEEHAYYQKLGEAMKAIDPRAGRDRHGRCAAQDGDRLRF